MEKRFTEEQIMGILKQAGAKMVELYDMHGLASQIPGRLCRVTDHFFI